MQQRSHVHPLGKWPSFFFQQFVYRPVQCFDAKSATFILGRVAVIFMLVRLRFLLTTFILHDDLFSRVSHLYVFVRMTSVAVTGL